MKISTKHQLESDPVQVQSGDVRRAEGTYVQTAIVLVGLADVGRHQTVGVVEAPGADAAVVHLRHQTVARHKLHQNLLTEELRRTGRRWGGGECPVCCGRISKLNVDKTSKLDRPSRFYLEDELFNPGPLGQEVQHGEAGVGPHRRHGHPVASARARPDVVGEAGQVVDERFHPPFVQTRNVDSGGEGKRRSQVCSEGGGALVTRGSAAANHQEASATTMPARDGK